MARVTETDCREMLRGAIGFAIEFWMWTGGPILTWEGLTKLEAWGLLRMTCCDWRRGAELLGPRD